MIVQYNHTIAVMLQCGNGAAIVVRVGFKQQDNVVDAGCSGHRIVARSDKRAHLAFDLIHNDKTRYQQSQSSYAGFPTQRERALITGRILRSRLQTVPLVNHAG